MKILLSLFINILLHAQLLDYDIEPASDVYKRFIGINILDSKELSFKNQNIHELSALAFENDNLYALSDSSDLYHFKIDLRNDKINSLKLLKSLKLKNKKGKALKKKKSDSEGMTLVDDELYISFERKPRVEVYSLNGDKLRKYKIQKKLRYIDNYRGKNKALESIAFNKNYGVIVAPEVSLKGEKKKYHTLYAKGRSFKFKSSGKLSALEFISDDTIMALERDFSFMTFKRVVSLTKVYLNDCNNEICESETIAKLSTSDGWKLDNFEGLTKVDENRFLMVSDDNDSFFQKTLLVFFEILKPN